MVSFAKPLPEPRFCMRSNHMGTSKRPDISYNGLLSNNHQSNTIAVSQVLTSSLILGMLLERSDEELSHTA